MLETIELIHTPKFRFEVIASVLCDKQLLCGVCFNQNQMKTTTLAVVLLQLNVTCMAQSKGEQQKHTQMLRALAKHSTRLPLPHPLLRVSARGLLKIVPEYVRGVRLALGKFSKPLSAGLWLNVPIYHKCLTIDMRDHVLQLPKQETITYDNVTIQVRIIYVRAMCTNASRSTLRSKCAWSTPTRPC